MSRLLPFIPGGILASSQHDLPSPATSTEDIAYATADVPGVGKVRITYKRRRSRRGKMENWFWTPQDAENAAPEPPTLPAW